MQVSLPTRSFPLFLTPMFFVSSDILARTRWPPPSLITWLGGGERALEEKHLYLCRFPPADSSLRPPFVFRPGWPILLALTGVPALIQLLSLPFFPESPRYTLIEKGDEETARQGTGTQAAHPGSQCTKGHGIGRYHLVSLRSGSGSQWTETESRELVRGEQW